MFLLLQVRTLLGTNSYELFTLDKLINKLIVHLRIMAQVRKQGVEGMMFYT